MLTALVVAESVLEGSIGHVRFEETRQAEWMSLSFIGSPSPSFNTCNTVEMIAVPPALDVGYEPSRPPGTEGRTV
jgi:hypothetical protein